MADGDRVRVEVGFRGGQVLALFVAVASADELDRALQGDGKSAVVVLETDDGPAQVVVPQVAYFRRFARSSRVGFGAAA